MSKKARLFFDAVAANQLKVEIEIFEGGSGYATTDTSRCFLVGDPKVDVFSLVEIAEWIVKVVEDTDFYAQKSSSIDFAVAEYGWSHDAQKTVAAVCTKASLLQTVEYGSCADDPDPNEIEVPYDESEANAITVAAGPGPGPSQPVATPFEILQIINAYTRELIGCCHRAEGIEESEELALEQAIREVKGYLPQNKQGYLKNVIGYHVMSALEDIEASELPKELR